MSLSTVIDIAIKATQILSAENITNTARNEIIQLVNMKSGTTAGKADLVWSDRRSLASTTESLDLTGALTDSAGAIVVFANIKFILFRNRNVAAGEDLEWGPHATNGWGTDFVVTDVADRRRVPSGRSSSPEDYGIDMWYDPLGSAVVANTTDIIEVNSLSATVSYDILIIGTSA